MTGYGEEPEVRSLPELYFQKAKRKSVNAHCCAYADAQKHLAAEFHRIDLLLHLHLLRQRARQPLNPLESFKGLVITEEEVGGLLKEASEDDGTTPQTNELRAQIACVSPLIQQQRATSAEQGINLPLNELARLFSLSTFEQDCLLLALAPELNCKYEKLYAFLQDDVTRKQPTVDLALTLFCAPNGMLAARCAFTSQSALLHYRLIELSDSGTPLISRAMKLDDRIANYLVGISEIDARIATAARVVPVTSTWGDSAVSAELQKRLRDFIEAHFSGKAIRNTVFHLRGPKGSGAGYLAECACRDLGMPLLLADAAKMLGGPLPFEESFWLLAREACLQSAVLGLENFDSVLAENNATRINTLIEAAQTFSPISFFFGQLRWEPVAISPTGVFLDVPIPRLNVGERKRFWETQLARSISNSETIDTGALASKFQLTPGRIHEALAAAAAFAEWRSPTDGQPNMDDFLHGCRASSSRSLDALARQIEPVHHWDDIVLPVEALDQLHEICERVQHGHRVFSEWGFERKLSLGRGANALFAGPSGTGKTMAAEIIANELGLELYKIDLSSVVSKYIGETEKNLNAVFAAAENSNGILFFDEADALFGKRSEVRDSHDRYANLEISYLLQKMEEYDGAAILATNFRQNLDESFVRRLAFTIHFPFPEEADRYRIWKGIWPAETPLAEDIDFTLLSREYKLSGGNIKNVALAAAFLAADNGGKVNMGHLLHATRREFQKMGKMMPANRSDSKAEPQSANV